MLGYAPDNRHTVCAHNGRYRVGGIVARTEMPGPLSDYCFVHLFARPFLNAVHETSVHPNDDQPSLALPITHNNHIIVL